MHSVTSNVFEFVPRKTARPDMSTHDAPPSDVSNDRVQHMRRAIHDHLQQHNVYSQIRGILNSHAAEHVEFNPNSPDDVMGVLRERGLIQQVIGNLEQPGRTTSIATGAGNAGLSKMALGPNERILHVRLVGGRAFLENFDDGDGQRQRRADQVMYVNVHFGAQRFRSSPQPCVCDPPFDDDFILRFPPSVRELVECGTPLHVTVTSEHKSGLRSTVVGENVVEWRKVLKNGFLNMSVELAGPNPGVPAGLVELQLEMIPHHGRQCTDDEISLNAERERSGNTASDREFLIYARRWWQEFHAVRPGNASRKVKVFAQATNGRMLPVTHFVSALQPDRVLDGPEDAARFVSLFAIDAPTLDDAAMEVVAGSRAHTGEQWQSTFHFLCQRRGDAPNHAALLCSLLLGFGLDAYCATGSDKAGATVMFVVVRRRGAERNRFTVTFWDPTTGQQYEQHGGHNYAAIGSVFNHYNFFGNVAENDAATSCDFDLDDETKWKAMNPVKLRMVSRAPPVPLLWAPLSERQLEISFEERFRSAVTTHRDGLGHTTMWDDDLGFVFTQALSRYETQRRGLATALDLGNFHAGVKGMIGDGRTFKAFPINVAHCCSAKVLRLILASATGKAIAEAHNEETYLAVRAKAYAFPESVVSLWVMIGVRYRSLPQ
jgi:centrosomal protein CEP76